MRRVALIVLAWNRWPLTRRCLDSLLASALDAAEIIVVDNGSRDETPTALAAYADRVRVLTLTENLGFVRGMNAGIAAAQADDDVVLLNNDLLFTQVDWLGRLRDAAYAAPENGIVGCRLLGPETEGRVYHVGGYIEPDDLHGEQTESGHVEREVAQYPGSRRVQVVAFAIAYIRRDCLQRMGVLDTAFHSYFEDADYCLRAAEVGIASIVAGAVTLRHDQHGSTMSDGGFRERLFAQSRATFGARWRERLRKNYCGDAVWHGVTRFPAEHAELARSLLRRLDARGLRMAFAPSTREVADAQDRRLDLAARRRIPAMPDIALVCAPDASFAQAQARHRVALAFGEWQRVPETWAHAANALDRLLVPDPFQRDAFRAAGVRIPIDILPIGVDRDYCHIGVPTPRDPHHPFVFLAVAADLSRDAPERLVAAFRRAFVAESAVRLLIHIRPGRDATAIAAVLAPLCAGDARIRVLDQWGFPWHQRAQLLAAADAYVAARRGGGWHGQAAETIACGKILIATDFGSQAELVRAYGFPVAVARLVEDPAQPGLRWAEPDEDALCAQLREVFERRAELVPRARAQADAFARRCDIDASADRLFETLARVSTLAPPRAAPAAHAPARQGHPASGQIVVLGMHRSGTSSIAGLLARMGVWPGPEDDLLIGPDNPKGHYESGPLHGACLRRLGAAGGDWRQPPIAAPAAAIDAFRREVTPVLDALDQRRPWLIKEPRLCLIARELLPLLSRPVFVHVVRDPHAVADSLAARDGLDRTHVFALWEQYTRSAFAASRGELRVLVDYADLLADPVALSSRLYAELRAFGIEGLSAPDPVAVHAWAVPPARRARSAARDELDPAQRALWDALKDRSILDDDAPQSHRDASDATATAPAPPASARGGG
jgi:GT2 family glycosyltransferase/glycosyltransferase involved in cell wall biosynthesis